MRRSSTYAAEADGAMTSSRLWREIRVFHELMEKFRALNVDETEFACLKGIVLFKTGAFGHTWNALFCSTWLCVCDNCKAYISEKNVDIIWYEHYYQAFCTRAKRHETSFRGVKVPFSSTVGSFCLHFYSFFQRRKSFENRLGFDKFITISSAVHFLEQCIYLHYSQATSQVEHS